VRACVRVCVCVCVHNVIPRKLVLLSLMNIVVDDTYLISGIYTDIRTFLCRKCDYQSSNEIDDYRLVFQGRRLREEKNYVWLKYFLPLL